MTTTDAPLDRRAVAARLRAAGCVFAEEEASLLLQAEDERGNLADMVHRRSAGEPLEHVLGWAEFCGRRIAVGPGVFVPRRRSEFLAELARGFARDDGMALDLCCGTGAVGLVVVEDIARAHLFAVDIDKAAVACARRNLATVHGRVFQGDLYTPLPCELHGSFQVIVANAPYVPSGEVAMLPPEARDYEPRIALDGGTDGLDIQRRIIAGAREWLAHQGRLLVETSDIQVAGTLRAFGEAGLSCQVAHSDDVDATVVIAVK